LLQWIAPADKDAVKDPHDICIKNRSIFIEGKRPDGSGRIPADPFERQQLLVIIGQCTPVPLDRFTGNAMKAFWPNVVAQWIPNLFDLIDRRQSQFLQTWIAIEELKVLGNHTVDLRLLEHHFGDENVVGIGCFSPGEIAAMAGVPPQQALLEPAF
jgi:hypothetical protein